MSKTKTRQLLFCYLLALVASLCVNTMAQHIRGALEGTVADQNGAVLSGAKVVVKNEATSAESSATVNDRGYFNVQNLEAGTYTVTVEQSGFHKYIAKSVEVKVGAVTPLTIALQVGATEQTVEVTATSTEATVDTSRATVDGVVTTQTIENLPLNGRNFLDLAQLEPGVQVRDGGDFDPTKNQMVGVSIGGRNGRSTRIQVDGVDITDENVGTTTTNLSNESIQEFQVSRSSLDPSTDLTSSGAINIVTRSGGNQFHGSGFSYFRNESYAADLREGPAPNTPKPPFERQDFGGNFGGYFIKDRLFWHIEGERNRQNGQQFTSTPNFPAFTASFPVPLRETNIGGRLDFNVTQNLKTFYRFNHNDNIGVTGFGLTSLSAFANDNFTNWHVVGADYSTSRWTHSLRYSNLNFNNSIVDANSLAGTPDTLDPTGIPVQVSISGQLTVGPNPLAPQETFQDNNQIKYDSSVTTGNHTVRFGASYNHITEGGFASFFADAPRVSATFSTAAIAAANGFGGSGDPLNFPLTSIRLGNSLGFASEKPADNLPFGGFFDNRIAFYGQDSWKIKRNLTLNFGLRYDFDTNIVDNDLSRAPLLAQFSPTLAGKIDRPADLFAPQVGFAYDIFKDGKTVIRGGAGIFYDSNIVNNILFDRAINLPPGLGNDTPSLNAGNPILPNPGTGACLFDVTQYNSAAGNCVGGVNLLGQPLKNVIAAAQNIQAVYQQVSKSLAANFSPTVGTPLINQTLDTGNGLIYNNYKRPYSMMFNIGVEREIKPGLVLSVDYLRNRGLHFGQLINLNRNGAADTLNLATARTAIAATANNFTLSNGATPCAGRTGSRAINCVIANNGSIIDFANNGLDSGSAVDGFAFQGNNPNFRNIGVIAPVGQSLYNALSVSLRGRLGNYGPFKGTTMTVGYSFSRFDTTGADSDAGFLSGSVFNDAPTKFFGPSGLDRTHQLTFSFLTELPMRFKISSTSRFATALPQSIFLPQATSNGVGEIFFTDLNGDGTTGDPLPGTNRGSFGRGVDVTKLNQLITNFNSTVATGLTPAAQALVNAGLFTQPQLIALGATINNGQSLTLAPANQVGLDSFMNTDVRISRSFGFKERVRIEPMVEVFNLFNVANYDSPGNPLSGVLDGSIGSINGTTPLNRNNRYGLGSGSFAPGIPRALQFGIRVGF
ncbi:MAG: TonB-dependent receptor [Chloracidobacterium sp.]|nr:TonB-dependent receptor [Chloracidobacterium sp.]